MRHNIKVYISGCLLQLLKCHLVAVRGKADSGSKWHLLGKGLRRHDPLKSEYSDF